MSKHIILSLLVAVVVGLLGTSALAEPITPVDADASSYYTPWSMVPDNLYETTYGSYERLVQPDLADASTWYITNYVNGGTGWCSNNEPVADTWVTLDLGAEYDLAAIDLWQYYNPNATERGVKDFKVWKVTDMTGATVVGSALCTGTLANVDGTLPAYYQQFALTGATGVRFIKIDVDSNHGGNQNYVAIGSVAFESIPEPSTLALLAAGLIGLLAYAWRKRK